MGLGGFVDNPLEKAPNAKQMQADERAEASLHDENPNNNNYRTKTKNYTYSPMFQNQPLNVFGFDKNVTDFLERARSLGITINVK